MKRRQFIKTLTATAATAGITAFATPAIASGKYEWKMLLAWPKDMEGLGTGAVRLAHRITALSEGKLTVIPYGVGELASAAEIFDAVANNEAEMGHSVPYYWLDKNRSTAFFGSVPGGLTAQEQNGWLYYGGGQALWDELYGEFNLKAFPAGNTGIQMGGWYKKEIHDLKDIQGLKMRMQGLASEVFNKLGGRCKTVPPQDIAFAMRLGQIDGVEWIGPWSDMKLGLHKLASYYYGPAFQEGAPTLELMINKKAYDGLPKELQLSVQYACAVENDLMNAEFHANNIQAFQSLKKERALHIRTYPSELLKAFFATSEDIVASTAHLGAINKRIYDSYAAYRKYSMEFTPTAERGYLNARAG